MLEHYRVNRSGHKLGELEELLRTFGFEPSEGAKHLLYCHPRHPDLVVTITRGSGELDPGYFASAVKRIDDMLQRERAAVERET